MKKGVLHSDSCSQLYEVLSNASAEDEVIVDFDETLLLRNSTAEYLSTIRPSLAAALVFRVLSVIRPWRWLTPKHSEEARDWFQVVVLTVLFPWNYWRWKREAKKVAQEFTNRELARALEESEARVTVATFGYRFVVDAILREMGGSYERLVACRFWEAHRDRVRGKVELLELDAREEEGKLIAVTDSEADAPLLERCDHAFLIQWPGAKSRAPFLEVYLPFLYLLKVKWPGRNYLLRNIFGDDIPLYLLVYALVSAQPLGAGFAIVLFAISFWCIYERGYNENDEIGERKEEEPKLSEAYFERVCRVPEGIAWAWALVFGLLGAWVFVGFPTQFFEREALEGIWSPMLIWTSVLFGCRLVFWVYNQMKKAARPLLYPLLQVFRYAAFVVLFPVSLVGVVALCSQVTARSLNYFFYRQRGGKDWPVVPEQVIRLGIFILLLATLLVGFQEELMGLQALLVFLWFLLRASNPIVGYLRRVLKPAMKS